MLVFLLVCLWSVGVVAGVVASDVAVAAGSSSSSGGVIMVVAGAGGFGPSLVGLLAGSLAAALVLFWLLLF